MKIIDLTHTIVADMPVYPGTPKPAITPACSMDQDGFTETRLDFSSHTGTHVDAPLHLIPTGAGLDQLPLSQFFGLAVKLDVSGYAGQEIPLDYISAFADKLETSEFLVLHSGWDQKWHSEEYFTNFPVLSREAAEYLAALPLQGVGVDMLSVDAVSQAGLPVHHLLLGAGKIIIENLCNLAEIHGDRFLLCVLPLKYASADGSPVRAVAFQAPVGIYYPE
jgi:kynurenine formamidase